MDTFNHGDRVRFTAATVARHPVWRGKVGTVTKTVGFYFGEIVSILWDEGGTTREGAVLLEREWDV